MRYKKTIEKTDSGERLDRIIPKYFPEITRSYAKFLIEKGKVSVNSSLEKPSFRVKEGDFIQWEDFEKKQYIKTKNVLNIVFQNKDFLVINKPAGIAVHPKETIKPREEITILDILVKEFPDIKRISKERPGIVHRLDRRTSGLLVVALNKKTLDFLKNQFQKRQVKKVYKALVFGKLEPKEGVIDAPIGRNPKDKSKMAVTSPSLGKQALTEYKVLEYFPPGKDTYSLILVYPKTGRTHQIRVHFSSIGHPVVGDGLYGPKKQKENLSRQFLHASIIGFKLQSGEYKEFKSELPKDLKEFLKTLKKPAL